MRLKAKFLYLIIFFFIFSAHQLFSQRYYKVVKGNDNPTIAEQVDDDVKTIDDILTRYKVSESKTSPTKENYDFWVEFVDNNNMSIKRKKMIYSFLEEMKSKLKS